MDEAFARMRGGDLWLLGAHIAPYAHGNVANHDPLRPRKLLLHRHEISKLGAKVAQQGLTLVPLRLYLKDGIAKVELALARGRKRYDKRAAIAKREAERDMARAVRRRD